MNELVPSNSTDSEVGLQQQYLSFRCRGEHYALPIDLVREIIEYGGVTTVPMMPAFIRGVINLRGHVVPVVDLASRFELGSTDLSRRTCIVILSMPDGDTSRRLGLVVESVDSVFDLDQAQVEPAPEFGAGIRADFIQGMVHGDEGFTVLLDIGNVLSIRDMRQLAEARTQGSVMMESPAG